MLTVWPSIVVLRTEASRAIGFGHLSRCLTLAAAFRARGVRCVFALSRESADAARNLESGSDVRVLAVEPGSLADAEAIAELAKELATRAVVADHYGFRGNYTSHLRALHLCCAYVDDFASGYYDCDAVLNHNVFAEGLVLDAPASCVQLLGPKYALVREPFRIARQRRASQATETVPQRVLVTLGGSDSTGTTLCLLSWLRSAELGGLPAMHVRVVLGPAFEDVDEARRLASQSSAHELEVCTNVSDLSGLCEWAELVVTAAGVTCLEIACVGVPMLAVCLADNQRKTAEGVAQKGMALNLGEYEALTEHAFVRQLTMLRRDHHARRAMVYAQHMVVDGNGPDRAAAGLAGAFV